MKVIPNAVEMMSKRAMATQSVRFLYSKHPSPNRMTCPGRQALTGWVLSFFLSPEFTFFLYPKKVQDFFSSLFVHSTTPSDSFCPSTLQDFKERTRRGKEEERGGRRGGDKKRKQRRRRGWLHVEDW